MPKTIAPLPRGHYWATPDAPFPLGDQNGHDEVFSGAQCVSDGKWVIFYKNGGRGLGVQRHLCRCPFRFCCRIERRRVDWPRRQTPHPYPFIIISQQPAKFLRSGNYV